MSPQDEQAAGGQIDVLFVSHEASRTGAPLMLLYFLRWLRANTDLRFELLLLQAGPLRADFEAVAPVTLWDVDGEEDLPAVAHAAPTVYCNCVRSILVVPRLAEHPTGRTVVTHVHELEGGVQLSLPGPGELALLFRCTDQWVAASDLVARSLVERHGLDPATIARHYEFIDVEAFAPADRPPGEGAALREQLAIPPDAAVVGAMGAAEWRKGPDLFLPLAVLLADRPVHFVWVGSDPSRGETQWLTQEVDRAGLGDRVHFLGVDEVPARWLDLFDVFVLTSREDPFPLVCLESSLLGTPIVCFDNTGMAEFADGGRYGYIVPYLDIEAMADQVAQLLDDPGQRAEVGARAARHVRAAFDVSVGAPALFADLQRWRRDGGDGGGG